MSNLQTGYTARGNRSRELAFGGAFEYQSRHQNFRRYDGTYKGRLYLGGGIRDYPAGVSFQNLSLRCQAVLGLTNKSFHYWNKKRPLQDEGVFSHLTDVS